VDIGRFVNREGAKVVCGSRERIDLNQFGHGLTVLSLILTTLLSAMKRLAVVVLLVTGCVSVSEQQVSPHALENALNAQAKWLRGLERGQPIQDITLAVAPARNIQ
jgi:hypothetical protein